MTELKIVDLTKEMVQSFNIVLGEDSQEIKAFAMEQSRKLATCLVRIGELSAKNEIDQETAQRMLEIEKLAVESVCLTISGLKQSSINNMLTTALTIVKPIVNSKLGWLLI